MSTCRMTSRQYFANILFQISQNNKRNKYFQNLHKNAVENCPRWNFQTPRKPRNSVNKSGNSFGGHPVVSVATCVRCRFLIISSLAGLGIRISEPSLKISLVPFSCSTMPSLGMKSLRSLSSQSSGKCLYSQCAGVA